MKSLRKSMKHLDFFGKSTNILFKKGKSYKTTLGFSCSLILIILSSLGTIYFANILFSRLNPTVTFSQQRDLSPLNLKAPEFFIGLDSQNLEIPQNKIFVEIFLNEKSSQNLTVQRQSQCGELEISNVFCLNASVFQEVDFNFVKGVKTNFLSR